MNEKWTFGGKQITCKLGQLWQRKKNKGYLIEGVLFNTFRIKLVDVLF